MTVDCRILPVNHSIEHHSGNISAGIERVLGLHGLSIEFWSTDVDSLFQEKLSALECQQPNSTEKDCRAARS